MMTPSRLTKVTLYQIIKSVNSEQASSPSTEFPHSSSGSIGPLQKPKVYGRFFKIKFSKSFDILSARLIIAVHEVNICHQGVKVRLEGNLELVTDSRTQKRRSFDLFEGGLRETGFEGLKSNLCNGHHLIKFTLSVKDPEGDVEGEHQLLTLPTPFESPCGRLRYRLVALMRNSRKRWEPFAHKELEFHGYSNIKEIPELGLESEEGPFVQRKQFDGGISSTLSLSGGGGRGRGRGRGVVQGQSYTVSLALEGACREEEQEINVDVRLCLVRKTIFGVKLVSNNVHTDVIWENKNKKRKGKKVDMAMIYNWEYEMKVPKNAWITFSSHPIKEFSVTYILKYKIKLRKSSPELDLELEDEVEIVVGTCGGGGESSSGGETNPHPIGSDSGEQGWRRASLSSLFSMLSLPPSYSQLSSRATSLMSLETLPPHYEDIYN